MMNTETGRRLGERAVKDSNGRVIDAGGYVTEVKVRDISATGARIEVAIADVIPRRFYFYASRHAPEQPAELVWRKGRQIGVRFVNWNEIPAAAPAPVPVAIAIAPANKIPLADLRKLALTQGR